MLNMKALREIDPAKAELIDDIFGYRVSGMNIPTYNVSRHELSDTFTHEHLSTVDKYVYERLRIKQSCEEGTYCSCKSYMVPGIYIPAYKLPTEILKAIKHEIGNMPYLDWLYNKLLSQMLQFKIELPKKGDLFFVHLKANHIYYAKRQNAMFRIYGEKITGNWDLYRNAYWDVAYYGCSKQRYTSILENSPKLVEAINWFTEAYEMLYI